MHLDDTIVAIATPPGRGGIGVVRLSGPDARAIAAPILRLPRELEPGRAIFGELIEPITGERIDEVVATWFAKPHSYTTDDVVEISAHGSPVVLRHIVELALARGARLADPGEFTMRAFLNGRLDLTQAEAVRDLIDSQTLFQAKVAAQQLEGAVSHRVAPIKAKLVELIALMEAGVDFAEDDVEVMPAAQITARIADVRSALETLSSSFDYGRLVHEGFTLAIIGPPNVGKSSLFNRLVERERAIVAATPGTTRDLVSETVAIGGIPVKLIDTAGIRHTEDEAERIGVAKSMEAAADADLVLVVFDYPSIADNAPRAETVALCRNLLARTEGLKRFLVVNKIDLRDGSNASRYDLTALLDASETRPNSDNPVRSTPQPHLETSVVTGAGLDTLRTRIVEAVGGTNSSGEAGFLTNVRQHSAVTAAINALAAALRSTEAAVPHEMILLDLYNALHSLDELTGATTADDILNQIFGTFCIGK